VFPSFAFMCTFYTGRV